MKTAEINCLFSVNSLSNAYGCFAAVFETAFGDRNSFSPCYAKLVKLKTVVVCSFSVQLKFFSIAC